MARYIELDAVIAEIERLQDVIKATAIDDRISKEQAEAYKVCVKLRFFVEDTLEVKEVDLEKHLKEDIEDVFFDLDGVAVKGATHYITVEDVKYVAKHFFELGLKVEDWEKKRMEECPYRQVGCTMYEGKILECRGACSWVVDYPKLKELKHRKENSMTGKMQKKPVSEDLREAARKYFKSLKDDCFISSDIMLAFKAGAKWKEEQYKKNLLDVCKKQTEEEAEIERDFIEGIIDEHRLPTFDDAIKYGMSLQKEQMMAKAIDAVVSQVPCSNEIILYNPSSVYEYSLPQEMNKLGLNKGDKVKVVIIKSE